MKQLHRSEKEIILISIDICEREIKEFGVCSYVGQKAEKDIELLKQQLKEID